MSSKIPYVGQAKNKHQPTSDTVNFISNKVANKLDRELNRNRQRTVSTPVNPSIDFESMFVDSLMSYCHANEIDATNTSKLNGKLTDIDRETSLRTNNAKSSIAHESGVLRLSVTNNFSCTSNMPVIYDSPAYMQTDDNTRIPIQFGIRTANGEHGFSHPVIVVGIDDPQNETYKLDDTQLRKLVDDNAKEILKKAGFVLAAYNYRTNPDYAAHIDSETFDKTEAHDIKFNSKLFEPNPKGTRSNMRTHNPSETYIASLTLTTNVSERRFSDKPISDAKGDANKWVNKLMQENQELTAEQDGKNVNIDSPDSPN